jgi:hypothetical protein
LDFSLGYSGGWREGSLAHSPFAAFGLLLAFFFEPIQFALANRNEYHYSLHCNGILRRCWTFCFATRQPGFKGEKMWVVIFVLPEGSFSWARKDRVMFVLLVQLNWAVG